MEGACWSKGGLQHACLFSLVVVRFKRELRLAAESNDQVAMSKEGDHHYIAQFQLRQWADPATGKLVRWGRVAFNGKLTRKEVTSAQTGYKPGLYALTHVPPEEAQRIETEVFQPLESEGAMLLERLISSGPSRLPRNERLAWAHYVNASVVRVPHLVDSFEKDMQALLQKELVLPSPEFDQAAEKGGASTLLEWGLKYKPDMYYNSGKLMIERLIKHKRPIDRLVSMPWVVRHVEESDRPLMISDNPVQRFGSLFSDDGLVMLPLTPRHLFVAVGHEKYTDAVKKVSARRLVGICNGATLRSAREFAYGIAEETFVERNLLRPEHTHFRKEFSTRPAQ